MTLVEHDPFFFCGGEDGGVRSCRAGLGAQDSIPMSLPSTGKPDWSRERWAEAREKG